MLALMFDGFCFGGFWGLLFQWVSLEEKNNVLASAG